MSIMKGKYEGYCEECRNSSSLEIKTINRMIAVWMVSLPAQEKRYENIHKTAQDANTCQKPYNPLINSRTLGCKKAKVESIK